MPSPDVRTRRYAYLDEEAVVALSLRAWRPVFASLREVLGEEVFTRLHGTDWRAFQERAVRDTLANPAMTIWVAEAEGRVVGFVASTVVDKELALGEIRMIAVDPDAQGRGIGGTLTELATGWLRGQDMRLVMIDTGGDDGHAAARRVYQKSGYAPLPLSRYFRPL